MAIKSVNEIHEGRGGEQNRDGVKYVRNWKVEVEDLTVDDEFAALHAPDIPIVNEQHRSDPSAGVSSKTATPLIDEEGINWWLVTVTYDDKSDEGGGGGGGPDEPENQPGIPSIQGNSGSVFRDVDQDTAGEAITNSAGDPEDPPHQIEYTDQTFTLSARIPFDKFNPVSVPRFLDTLNDNQLLVMGEQKGKLSGFNYRNVRVGDEIKWDISIVWKIRDDWKLSFLDRGLFTADATSGSVINRQPVLDDLGFPVPIPVLLDGNGKVGGPAFREFDVYFLRNHNALITGMGLSVDIIDYFVI